MKPKPNLLISTSLTVISAYCLVPLVYSVAPDSIASMVVVTMPGVLIGVMTSVFLERTFPEIITANEATFLFAAGIFAVVLLFIGSYFGRKSYRFLIPYSVLMIVMSVGSFLFFKYGNG